MDIAKLVERVKSILLSPRSEWPVIAAEPATVKGLYTGYVMILAAIPAVFGFIKGSLIGHGMFGVTVTTSIAAGIVGMVMGYVLGLVMLYVVALVINALAPTFDGQKDQVQAVKAAGYAWTAAWVAGIAVIVPWLGWLVALAGGVYSIYLLFIGLPHTMKCPPEKAAGYTALSVVIAVVLSWILALVVGGVTAMGVLGGAAAGSSARTHVTFDEDSRLGRIAALGERMQAAAEAGEAKAKAGVGADAGGGPADAKSQAEAMGAMMGAMLGGSKDGKPVESLAPDQIKAFLPDTLGGLECQSISSKRQASMGVQISEASATYADPDGKVRVNVELTDMAAMSGMMAMAGVFGSESESETAHGYEKTYLRNGQRIQEKWDGRTNRGKYAVMIGDRFQIEAEGQVKRFEQLKGIVGDMDLRGLEKQAK